MLTTGVDVIPGLIGSAGTKNTDGDDTIIATDTVFDTGDNINGGKGTDTLSLTLGAASTSIVTLNSVENVKISDFATATLNAVNWTGVTGLEFAGSTNATVVNNVGAIPTVTLNKTTHDVTVVNMVATAVAGSSDAATVNLNGLTDNTKTFTMNGIENLTLNATGADSKVRIADTGLKALAVTGDKKLDISAAAIVATTTSVDASAMTAGGLTIDVDGAAGLLTAKGGAGDDTFLFGAQAVGTTVVEGGEGNDTIGVDFANVAGLLATTSKVTGVETLRVQDAIDLSASVAAPTFDLLKVVGLANIRFDADVTVDSAAAVKILTVSNVASGGTVTFGADVVQTAAGNAGLIVNVKDAAATPTDTLTVKLTAGASVAADQTIAGMTSANVETVTIDSANLKDAATATIFTGLANDQLQVLNLVSSAKDATGTATKADDLTIGAGFTSTIINTVDASNFNGAVDITNLASKLIASGATLKGGSEDFEVTGGSGADQIFTGAGGSTAITGGLGADTINPSHSTQLILHDSPAFFPRP